MRVLDGKVAIVTGSSHGLGRAIALTLAKEGAAVTVLSRTYQKVLEVANEIEKLGGRALPVACNVRFRDQVDRAVAETVRAFGSVNILVNNARERQEAKPFEMTTEDDMRAAFESGPLGTLFFMQACFPYLRDQGGGKVINISSAAGPYGEPRRAAYSTAKEGMRSLTRVAAREWGRHGINVNCICPFAQTSAMQWWSEKDPKAYMAATSSVPLGRIGDPERDIGRAVVFLAGPDSDYVTGATLMVDGGKTMLH